MALNKVKVGSNMYQFLNEMSGGNGYTWNIIRGKCPHDCLYCYMKSYPQSELHFDEKELKTDLGSGNAIFVGSSCDMWAKEVPDAWIGRTLKYCRDDVYNRWLFQSKNPIRFWDWMVELPDTTTLGITLESNRCWSGSKAPCPADRYMAFKDNPKDKMVSIEPIMDFDLDGMARMIQGIKPQFVSIGADSQRHNLPEPSSDKVKALIEALREFTEVKIKDNLKRITEQS